MTRRLLLATRNHKKLAELQRILDSELGGRVVTLVGLADVRAYDEVPETGLTFADNALLKAREGARRTGLPTVADDSGLAVDALGGMPGVRSARWAGWRGGQAPTDQVPADRVPADRVPADRVPADRVPADQVSADQANLDLVLAQMSDVDDDRRGASFVCAAALVLPPPDGREFVVDGQMRGRLIREPRGIGGFGYDPIFVADGQQRTNAELPASEKDAISHRGKAFRALARVIATELGG